jgi:nicotinamide-nucleotide amidase
MHPMFTEEVIPYLRRAFPLEEKHYHHSLHFCLLPEQKVDPVIRELKDLYPGVDFGIYPNFGTLTVTVSTPAQEHEFAEQLMAEPISALKKKFERHYFESTNGKIDQAVHHLLLDRKLTLSIAESCTGGNVAAKLAQHSGASKYFLGSIVAYANEMKVSQLGVSPETLEKDGAVSQQAVQEMVSGVLKKTHSDVAVAITGIAGPTGGTETKPIGLLWCGFQRKGHSPEVFERRIHGSREMIIEWASNLLLAELYLRLREG